MVSHKMRQIEIALNQLDHNSSAENPDTSAAAAEQNDMFAEFAQHPASVGGSSPSFSMAVQPFSADQHHGKTPTLPKFKSPRISEHRHGVNPALAMNLLKEIETIVGRWQQELQTILQQIQDIYQEGPIIDGWLDSHDRQPHDGQATVRHTTTDRLRDYEEVFRQSDAKVSYQSPRTGYRLCGLDGNGQHWSRPCPAEEVPSVSLAIARYQKLRQLLSRKQDLETRLGSLAETLVVMHAHLNKD
ncbi:hypothetical protein [Lyngbya aestuarii]|uniref:hypothetical protein n=1 Tax=Lyngbya aestuarii TaxID=118322 RepID=UPI00403DB82D